MAVNVLIVDDSATTRGVIRKVLAGTELPVAKIWEAVNGREALEKMRTDWVDLVLADLNMPDMDGHQMIEEMKKDELLAGLPVVVISSEGDQKVLEDLVASGVREVVRKPFTPMLLKGVLERVLGAVA